MKSSPDPADEARPNASAAGTHADRDRLLEQVYEQLRAIARRRLAGEQAGHTLQPTALVNEAYLKLSRNPSLFGLEKSRFLLAAAEAMRRILIDHARTRNREKRGGAGANPHAARRRRDPLADVSELAVDFDPDQTLALNEALCRLEQLDDQAAQVVKLRFFAGLSVEETAEAMAVSPRTVKRDWAFARAWLYEALA